MFSIRASVAADPPNTSVYQRVLADAYGGLHPHLLAYFGPIPLGWEGVGVGTFRYAGLRIRMLRPLFAQLGARGIAFAEIGAEVPFTVRNSPGHDGALHSSRIFSFPRGARTMTDTMRVVDGRLVDRIGRAGELEIELQVRVVDAGLEMRSRRLALRIGGRRMPLPPIVRVSLREEPAPEEGGSQQVDLQIIAPLVGMIYGYRGRFTYALRPAATGDPSVPTAQATAEPGSMNRVVNESAGRVVRSTSPSSATE